MSDAKEERKKQLDSSVLTHLEANPDGIANSLDFVNRNFSDHELLVGVLKSLELGQYIETSSQDHSQVLLTNEGDKYRVNGSPEITVFQAIPEGDEGIPQDKLMAAVDKATYGIGFAHCMKSKWVSVKDKVVRRAIANVADETQKVLQGVKDEQSDKVEKKQLDELKRRKLVAVSSYKTYRITRGAKYAPARRSLATDITSDMLKTKEWADKEFKDYNWNALGAKIESGALHPLMKVRSAFRSVLLEMGFSEMPANNFVESSFWNFDSLFQPQQHPARDSHDTFFLHSPANCTHILPEYMQRVKQMHECGGNGSIGYRYDWKEEEARKNILRTHTTAVSARMLYQLAQETKATGTFQPKKYFSIDRVFRNETLDATHLAEFHQVEGLIADRNLTLGDLIGTIKTFFEKIDISDVRFKPAYNPYTEPSMEIFGFSKELGKWMEVGNSGVFRPEMLSPMGLPDDVRVIAWGLSLERPTMIKYGIKNIRDLFGPKVKLEIIADNPICRYGQSTI